jgi:hypothetical protein
VATADVDLVEMGNATVSGGDGDVLELDVHIVLGCKEKGLLVKDGSRTTIAV